MINRPCALYRGAFFSACLLLVMLYACKCVLRYRETCTQFSRAGIFSDLASPFYRKVPKMRGFLKLAFARRIRVRSSTQNSHCVLSFLLPVSLPAHGLFSFDVCFSISCLRYYRASPCFCSLVWGATLPSKIAPFPPSCLWAGRPPRA